MTQTKHWALFSERSAAATRETPVPTSSGIRAILEPMSGPTASASCRLLGMQRGHVHLSLKTWIEPGTKALLRVDRVTATGDVDYCNPKGDEYRMSFVVDRERSAPRFPIDEPGSLTVLGQNDESSFPCRLTDVSQSGLGLDSSVAAGVGSMICVQSEFMLAVGEVRHSRQHPDGIFHMGVETTDVLSETSGPRRRPSLRQRLAELVLGRKIGR